MGTLKTKRPIYLIEPHKERVSDLERRASKAVTSVGMPGLFTLGIARTVASASSSLGTPPIARHTHPVRLPPGAQAPVQCSQCGGDIAWLLEKGSSGNCPHCQTPLKFRFLE
ncbi:hypothetical protein ACFLXC_01560 [Chloroflexota bacterium]